MSDQEVKEPKSLDWHEIYEIVLRDVDSLEDKFDTVSFQPISNEVLVVKTMDGESGATKEVFVSRHAFVRMLPALGIGCRNDT